MQVPAGGVQRNIISALKTIRVKATKLLCPAGPRYSFTKACGKLRV